MSEKQVSNKTEESEGLFSTKQKYAKSASFFNSANSVNPVKNLVLKKKLSEVDNILQFFE